MGLCRAVRSIYKGRLSEARKKDRDLRKAAVFVEDLMGRPLKNDPRVIQSLFGLVTHSGSTMGIPSRVSMAFSFRQTRTSVAVHEIIHSEDNGEIPEKPVQKILKTIKGIFNIPKRIIDEGRAVFAADYLYLGKEKRFNLYFGALVAGVSLLAISSISSFGWLPGAALLMVGALYWPFYNSLCTLAKEVGDPRKAFKMTTEKPPTVKAIFAPSSYYRDEIAALKETTTGEANLR